MTTSAGVGRFAFATSSAIEAKVPVTTRSSGNVAREMTAAGVTVDLPAAMRRALVSRNVERPM